MATMATTLATESEIDLAISDAQIEQMLSEKLMEGYVLMEATCPKCAVPLVKNHKMVPKTLSMDESNPNPSKKIPADKAIILPAESFEQPFKPVDGVPMCVGCDSHVITQETEIAILEQCGSLKDKGSIYVAVETANAMDPTEDAVVKQEIIHLEDITEDDIVVGSHRKHQKFIVDIEPSSFDMNGASHVEMTVSPKMGDMLKPIDVEEIKEETEELDFEEHSIRREIATKVLGAKMLQGWTLKEKICDSCAMPLMENKKKESCPVCPALAKRAKKMLKQKQLIDAEKNRLQREIQAKKDLVEQTERFEHIQTVRGEVEVRALKEDEEAKQRASQRNRAIQEEKERLLAMEKQQAPKGNEEEPSPDRSQERARGMIEEEIMELQRLEAIAKEEEERRDMIAKASGKESKMASKEAETKSQQEAAAKELVKEAEAIEAFDEAIMADDKTEAMKKDQLVEEHRRKVASKMTLDEKVAKLEEDRLAEAMEARRIAEERRIESESRMIAALEADAAMKALAAEDAIRRAKAALQEVSYTKQQIISTTIELAEKEAVAETEESLKARYEGHNEPVIVQSDFEIHQERWETLRLEGRAIMTRRLLKGWSISSEACVAKECHDSPLIEKDGMKECVVCGGCGNGTDGVFAISEEAEDAPTKVPPSVAKSMAESDEYEGEDWLGNGQEEKFEKMREIYSKEIGKKMLAGWRLVDSSCPRCVMPMMMDANGKTDICIVKGCNGAKKQIFDASTIATKDLADLDVFEEDEHRTLSPVVENIETTPSDESDLVSTILRQAPKQQKKRNAVVSSDPPAFKPTMRGELPRGTVRKAVIPLPVDLADADAIRDLMSMEEQQGRDDHISKDASIDTVANLFLKSPHGYDFQDFGRSMGVNEVKELVEIFLVTNVDKDVSDAFKFAVAKRILLKMNLSRGREAASPPGSPAPPPKVDRGGRFHFDDADYAPTLSASGVEYQHRIKPYPENSSRAKKMPPRSPGFRQLSPVYSPRSPRDDMSVMSRASTVASDALESIYDRIDQCKMKLMDPSNNLDEQIATAALLEKLAQAAVAVKEMEYIE